MGFGTSPNDAMAATESELDEDEEEPFERPKLSYKSKKKSARSGSASFSGRPAAAAPVDAYDGEDVPATTLNVMHSRNSSRSHVTVPTAAVYGSGVGGGGGGGGENGDEEEPFERPKLSYGGGTGFRSGSAAGPASSSR